MLRVYIYILFLSLPLYIYRGIYIEREGEKERWVGTRYVRFLLGDLKIACFRTISLYFDLRY